MARVQAHFLSAHWWVRCWKFSPNSHKWACLQAKAEGPRKTLWYIWKHNTNFVYCTINVTIQRFQISHKYGIWSLFTGKCNSGVVRGGASAPCFKSHHRFLYERPAPPWGICSFSKKNDKCQGRWACLELTEPLYLAVSTVKFLQVCKSNTRKLLSGSEIYQTSAH